MPDIKPDLSEVRPTIKQQAPQVEKAEEFRKVTPQEVDELFASSEPYYIHDENKRQKKLDEIKAQDPDGYERLNDINARRLKELKQLAPPEFEVTGEHFRYPGSFSDIKKAAQEELPQLEEALSRSKTWKEQWDSLTREEKKQKARRISELERGTRTENYQDTKGNRYPPERAREADDNNWIDNTEGRLKNQIHKLTEAVKIKGTSSVREKIQQLMADEDSKSSKDTSDKDAQTTQKTEQPPAPSKPSGGLLGRVGRVFRGK